MISVIMSTYNRGDIVGKAINSIIHQTYKNWEFIICDDGSTDNTLKCLNIFKDEDSRIHIIRNKQNLGLQKSLNKCLRFSKGQYIARIDDDDVSSSNRFMNQVNFLNIHHNIAFVGSNIYMKDENGIYGLKKFIKYPSIYQLFKSNEFCHAAIMIRTSIIKYVNGYSESNKFYRVEDYELWLRLYSLGYKGANIQKNLVSYTFHLNYPTMKFHGYFNRFRLLYYYRNKLNIGFEKYFIILISLIKMIIPPVVRNEVYKLKFYKGRYYK